MQIAERNVDGGEKFFVFRHKEMKLLTESFLRMQSYTERD